MLPEISGLTSYFQVNGKEALLTVMIILVIVLLVKREIGSLVGSVIIIGLLIVMVTDPESTIIKIAQGVINKVMQTGGG